MPQTITMSGQNDGLALTGNNFRHGEVYVLIRGPASYSWQPGEFVTRAGDQVANMSRANYGSQLRDIEARELRPGERIIIEGG